MDEGEQNPYAPPRVTDEVAPGRQGRSSEDGGNAWFENGQIILPRFGGELPERCVVCNRSTDFKLRRTVQWHAPGYYFLICAGWIVYLIVLLIVRKTAVLHLGLCDVHQARRKSGLAFLWGGVGAGLLLMLVGSNTRTPALTVLALVGMLAGVIAGATRVRLVTIKKIDEGHVYLTAGEDFMRSLPTSPDSDEPAPPPRKRKKKRPAKKVAPEAAAKTAAPEDDDHEPAPEGHEER